MTTEHKKQSHKHHKDAHPAHHKKNKQHELHKHHARGPKKKKPNYVLAVGVFIVLIAIVYGIVVLLERAGGASSDSKPAAIVNGEPITMAYLDEQYARIPPQYQAFVTKDVLLNQTINEVLLLQEAKKAGLSVSDDEVQAEIQKTLDAAGLTEAQLDQKLKEQNLTRKFLEDLYRRQLLINKLLEKKVFPKLKVSKQEVIDYYDSTIHAAHILVKDEDTAYDLIHQLQRTSASDLNAKFFQLAEENSVDPSAKTNKGDLGEFSKGMMVPEFEKAAFALEEGEFTTTPVKTQFGYHIILRLPKDKTLDEEFSDIESALLTKKKSAAVPLYVEQLRKKADIKILYSEDSSDKK